MKYLSVGLSLLAVAALGACAHRPISINDQAFGDAQATMTDDGTIRLKVRSAGPDKMFKNGVVEFKPGDAGYDALKNEVEHPTSPDTKKPVFIWEVGTPIYEP
jgi:hypothetical protein